MEEHCAIKVIGVGGSGMRAVHHMIASQLRGVTFIVAGMDAQALAWSRSRCENTLQLGGARFRGLSPGINRQRGREAAQESLEEIKTALAGAELVFVVTGMGGSTGSGAAPVIAQAAKELGALTIGVVTNPFSLEGKRRLHTAEGGIAALRRVTDCLILIPCNRIQLASKDMGIEDMMREADEAMHNAVRGISGPIMHQGLVSIHFAEMRDLLKGAGMAAMGVGSASGACRAREAAICALNSPLLRDMEIGEASGVLVAIACGDDLKMDELSEIKDVIHSGIHKGGRILAGVLCRHERGCGELHVTIIGTGMGIHQSRACVLMEGSISP